MKKNQLLIPRKRTQIGLLVKMGDEVNSELTYDQAIPLLGIHLKNPKH